MSFDGIVTKALVHELNSIILGGRIDKIYQYNNEILMHIYNKGYNMKLLISVNSNNPRIHLTNQAKSNPTSPPTFCMLMRKYLSRSVILNIEQYAMDRIILIDLSSRDELGQLTEKRLIVEVMGKYSNVILIDKNSLKIIDSIKRIPSSISRVRQVLPGISYAYPDQGNRTDPLLIDKDQFTKLINTNNGNKHIYAFFYTNFLGLGPLISKEICFQANIEMDRSIISLTDTEVDRLYLAFTSIIAIIKSNDFSPILINNKYDKDYLAFYAIKIDHLGNDIEYMDSISNVLDLYYTNNNIQDRIYQKSQSISKLVKTKLNRCLNKLSKQKQELLNSENREEYKVYADLISANLHNIARGLDEIELENFYSETSEKIRIPLDRKYSPAENAQRYYKKYSRLKNANRTLLNQIPETENEVYYLENVLNSIDNCTEVLELDEIKEELIKEGYLKGSLNKNRTKTTSSSPYHYVSSDGFHIFVGKNNKQNDNLTLKCALKDDIWFHVQKMPGSHVILKTENKEIPEQTIKEAAMLAAYYSKGKNSSNVPVDFTSRKNVKKPRNAKAGMVIYENFNTIFITPSIEYINKISILND